MLSTPQLIGAAGLVALTAGTTLAQDAPCDPGSTVVTENVDSTTITVGGSVSCNNSSGTSGHVYGRSHDLSLLGLTGDVSIGCVHWGIEYTDLPIDAIVSVFLDTDGNAAPGSSPGDLTLVGSMTVPDNNTVPHFITASFNPALTVAADDLIFVTIETPDSTGFPTIGANSAGESSPSYIRTLNGDCGIANWATTAGIGFPGSHWVQAIEIGEAAAVDPCDEPLADCPNDIDGDGTTTVDDILSIIGSFGQVGDGTYRPAGDVYPLPLGNCACDVDDLLSVISAFGTDCVTATGGCCNAGDCSIVEAADCNASGGTYLGDDSDCSGCVPVGDVMLNEARLNQPGADDDEYFELAGTAGTSLDGLTLLVIGDGTGGNGVIEEAVDLTGYAIAANGFFLCGEPTLTIGTPDLAYELNFESSDQTTHLLVADFTGINGDDLDTDDDGVLDIEPWSSVLDCIAYVGVDPALGDHIYCSTTVGPEGDYTPGHAYRCPDASGDWYVGTFELSILDTPGAANNCDVTDSDGDGVFDSVDNCPDLANPDQADCDGDGYGDACAIADGLSADCNSNNVPDECEGDCNGNGNPDDCDIADGISADCDGNNTPDECDPDCNGNGTPDVCDIANGTSQDTNSNGVPDECEGSAFVINEINADPDTILGDANGDGAANFGDDEFVEIVNMSGADMDMSAWTLADGAALRHTFPFGTIVGDGCAVVVFGGGTPTGSFGGAIVMVASGGSLGLNNGGDTVTIADSTGVIQLELVYGSAGNNQSITRNPDVYGTSFINHSEVAPDGALFSPGTRFDGVGFGGDCGGTSQPDDDGDGVPNDYDNCDLPNPDQADCNENGIGDVCDIADGTSIDDNGNGIPDECEQTVAGAWINEFHYDNVSSDVGEFVEIVLLDGVDIATVTLSFYNGSNGTVYNSANGTELTPGDVGVGYAIYTIMPSSIQNGAPDGLCLDIGGSIAHFISYEGALTATDGPAAGLTATDVGVAENSSTTIGSSIGLAGAGGSPDAFMWTVMVDLATPGTANTGQDLLP
jgi:hypothetical protein